MESTIDQPSLKRPRDSSSPENVGEADGDLSTSKQPRVPQEQQPATQTGTNDEGLGTGESRKEGPPPYGSQQYWEDRYRAQFADIERSVNKEEVSLDQQQVTVSDCDADGSFKLTTSQGDCPDPFHAWYFNYEELQPILLPLILGDNADAAQHDEISSDEEGGNEGPDNDGSSAGNPPKEMTSRNELSKEEKEGSNAVSTNDDSNKDWEGFEEVGSESEEEDETPIRAGLARDGPIAVLEVGCGDVPLGRDLAIGIEKLPVQDIPEIKDMEKDATDPTLVKPTMILQKVVCIDYSETVIQAMKAHQKQRESMIKAGEGESSDPVSKQATFNPTIPIEYHVADARDLPYPDKSYQLILEKGTLDAMLSDHEKGRSNCIAIVKECARVLSIGGEFGSSEYFSLCMQVAGHRCVSSSFILCAFSAFAAAALNIDYTTRYQLRCSISRVSSQRSRSKRHEMVG